MGWGNAGYVGDDGWYLNKAAGGAAFTGVGDSKSFIIWGSPAYGYSAAYAAPGTGPAIDLVDQAGANPITINVLSTGKTDVASINAWVTAHSVTTIKVAKLYDQVGTNHWVQATLSKMPVLVLSGINSLPSLQFTSANAQIMNSTASVSQAQPATLQAVAERTANFASVQEIIASVGTEFDMFFNSSANQVASFNSPNTLTATAADSAPHVLQVCPNGASSTFNVDGATQVTGTLGTDPMGNSLNLGGFATSLYLDGLISEAGAYAGTYNSGVQANARTRYGL